MVDECSCWDNEMDYCDFCGQLGEACTFCHPELEEDYEYDEE